MDTGSSQAMVNEEMMGVDHLEVIETVIASLQEDQSAMVSQSEQSRLWKFKYGSVEVFVQLTGQTDDDMLVIWSPVLKLPVKNEAGLMRKLLELNWTDTFESHFCITEDQQVVVLAQRTVAELSPAEVSRNITVVATVADNYDESLQQEFGQG